MNILILTTHLNPGGISRYAVNLARGLRSNHKIWVASSGGKWERKLTQLNVSFCSIPIRTKSLISIKIVLSLIKLLPFVVRHKIDVLCANTRVTQFLSYLIYRCSGIPYVSVFHGFYRPRLERRLFKFEGVQSIAVSGAVKTYCLNALGIPKQNVRVVYNGIEKEQFRPREHAKQEYGFKKEDVVLGMLGRISAEKGHFLALEAFKILKEKYKHISFLISGEGKLQNALRERIKQKHLEDRVRLLSLEGEEFLDVIDVLIVPSSREGFGFSVLEGFAKKVCVVGFSTGGVKEIIQDGQTGFLFYRYDAASLASTLEKVLEDTSLRKKVVENAYNSLDIFSLQTMAENTIEVFQKAKML